MQLRRFRVDRLPEEGGVVSLGAGDAKHANVLRLNVGDRVLLMDEEGLAAEATISELGAGRLLCRAGAPMPTPEPASVVLLLAAPKGARLDDCIRGAVEVGATAVRLVSTERMVVAPDALARRLERLRRIAREAARQSEQPRVATIEGPTTLLQAASAAPASATKFCFDARAEGFLPPVDAGEVWVAIGPEGGFSAGEIDALEAMGFRSARLPTGVLRVETAVPVALALVCAARQDAKGPGPKPGA